jgi:S-adenosylmethionine hydrolase
VSLHIVYAPRAHVESASVQATRVADALGSRYRHAIMRPARVSRSSTVHSVASRRPIVTLTSDFGLVDSYVAAMKAVLVRQCPEARFIDVTHQVPRQDVLCGSITLERAIDGFPPGTTHLAVVDPGVGSDRRLLIAEINQQRVVCPDNGLITWSWRRHPGGRAYELMWRPQRHSDTFHGRDIMAPAAARLACGDAITKLARPIDDPILLDIEPADVQAARGRIIHLDHFGNATTNISADALRAADRKAIRVKGRALGKLKRTYWDVAPAKPLALLGSSGLLEIAVRDGSAAQSLRLKVGDEVVLS